MPPLSLNVGRFARQVNADIQPAELARLEAPGWLEDLPGEPIEALLKTVRIRGEHRRRDLIDSGIAIAFGQVEIQWPSERADRHLDVLPTSTSLCEQRFELGQAYP